MRCSNRLLCFVILQSLQTGVHEIRPFEHLLKCMFELARKRAFKFKTQITPSGLDPIAVIFHRNVESAYESNTFIANEHLAMVPNAKPIQHQWIELPHFATSLPQRVPERSWQTH